MTRTLTSPLVGGHFRPPAKQVLAALPAGTALILSPEPDNPYDTHALKVLVSKAQIERSPELDNLAGALPDCGLTLEQLLSDPEPLQLGYCAAATNKKALPAGTHLSSNQELVDAMASASEHRATLAFSAEGSPQVRLTLD